MRFELDDILTEEILFYMENQDSVFFMDTHKGQIVSIENGCEDAPDFDDDERFIALPEWSPQDGYRLMEHFAASLKNPVVRQELSAALNSGKGVFRSFKNAIEQYPETEKLWFRYKNREMKNEVIAWYNSQREIWGLEPVGGEPEDTLSLILEDFIFRDGNDSYAQNAAALHKICVDEQKNAAVRSVYESINPFTFPGDICIVSEYADGEFAGFICAVKDSSFLRICAIEVLPEYRGMGLGKALLSKLLEKVNGQKIHITIDLPAGMEKFARALHLENFKPCVQRFILSS
jgi:ribosomal protein S18 acetylase RimI-like enzyme